MLLMITEMMSATFLCLPLPLWAGVCLAVAVAYFFFWPRPGDRQRDRFTQIVLRWFHSAVWLLLGIAALMAAAGSETTAAVTILLGMLLYVTFLVTLVRDQRQATRELSSASKE